MFKRFMSYLIVLIAIFSLHLVTIGSESHAGEKILETEYFKFYKFEGNYADVRVDLDYAITGLGIKVNGVSHIGAMLKRTGKDIGRTNKIYENAEAIQFCSAKLSRNMMEADPLNIVFCPYIIYIYSLPDEKNRVYLGYRKPPHLDSEASKNAVAAVVKMYEGIIADAK